MYTSWVPRQPEPRRIRISRYMLRAINKIEWGVVDTYYANILSHYDIAFRQTPVVADFPQTQFSAILRQIPTIAHAL